MIKTITCSLHYENRESSVKGTAPGNLEHKDQCSKSHHCEKYNVCLEPASHNRLWVHFNDNPMDQLLTWDKTRACVYFNVGKTIGFSDNESLLWHAYFLRSCPSLFMWTQKEYWRVIDPALGLRKAQSSPSCVNWEHHLSPAVSWAMCELICYGSLPSIPQSRMSAEARMWKCRVSVRLCCSTAFWS